MATFFCTLFYDKIFFIHLHKLIIMRKIGIALAIIVLVSCKHKTTDLNQDAAIKPNQFIAAFKPIESTFFATDTNINTLADTVAINHNLLSRFIPDSLVKRLTDGDKKTIFHPIGRISKPSETYILFLTIKNKKPFVSTLVFDKENKFLASKDLFSPHTDNEGYKYNLSINREPTFFIGREKVVNDKEVKFTKTGWAFNGTTFIPVVKESNERNEKLTPIINPIDTLLKEQLYSGTYVEDDRNYIALRDGRTKNEYHFFLHIDKNDGNCVGELKGTMQMTDSTHAIYNFAGDPCVIDFTFDRNIITIKEKGSCGNRRGMECLFDDAYTKKKETKRQLPKTSLITIKPTATTPVIVAPKKATKFSSTSKQLLLPTNPKQETKTVTKPKITTKQKAAIKPIEKPVAKPEENPYSN